VTSTPFSRRSPPGPTTMTSAPAAVGQSCRSRGWSRGTSRSCPCRLQDRDLQDQEGRDRRGAAPEDDLVRGHAPQLREPPPRQRRLPRRGMSLSAHTSPDLLFTYPLWLQCSVLLPIHCSLAD
jgi:hypothetical protein